MEWIEEADGVFRGGGVKGLGLAGALLGFAEHPTKPVKKWVNVAGASAGAILACYLATGHDAKDMVDADEARRSSADFQDFPAGGEYLRRRPRTSSASTAWRTARRSARGSTASSEHATFAVTKTPDGTDYRLKLIAVDVTNRALLVLPDDLSLLPAPGRDDGDRPGRLPDRRTPRG